MNALSVPADAATTTLPTDDWVGFGQLAREELQAYRTPSEFHGVTQDADNSPSLFLFVRISKEDDFQVSLKTETERSFYPVETFELVKIGCLR
jgi:hypothetical protein